MKTISCSCPRKRVAVSPNPEYCGLNNGINNTHHSISLQCLDSKVGVPFAQVVIWNLFFNFLRPARQKLIDIIKASSALRMGRQLWRDNAVAFSRSPVPYIMG